ncbi:sulfide/dihydroorotate dehydrogenase-like FAD/NAD-binding protein [Methanoplanus endosymbiosus]|uniref:Sulfide/dihydroorotate dehydrogenase-like FAD/NAD-binding protein n=1 Tax=Methanoplanus endosymbiosus TaxID=33865 RepID=A0A9E7PMU9_9EURY|nr:sulfide/dihydroorotate dehydrogenase-like FAD/NAD-binding protein [Methanoplanus endosymbiosus]UUX91854.1 sulfide/dihydroorotate dehydrogenase-like FAD/NAD-binding protein [Methanoplanus endosymbiosus]
MGYTIEKATEIADNIFEFWINAPHVTKNAQAGQFVVIRINDLGERIPLTISETDGSLVRIVFMAVGKTTTYLSTLKAGDEIRDIAGPLGHPSEMGSFGNCVVIGGGVGIACLPILARALKAAGNNVTGIIGARNESLLLLKDELATHCDELVVCTDDGSFGFHGFPADILKKKLGDGEKIDCVWIIGPGIMMKITSMATIPYKVRTYVSLNPIMVDGTGMCGSCRVTVGGETKFACVDGPEFDAHLVDWDELMARQRTYTDQERESLKLFRDHQCSCGGDHHE